jgi:hypothetical protein
MPPLLEMLSNQTCARNALIARRSGAPTMSRATLWTCKWRDCNLSLARLSTCTNLNQRRVTEMRATDPQLIATMADEISASHTSRQEHPTLPDRRFPCKSMGRLT